MIEQKSIKVNFIYNIIIQALQILAPLIITPYVSRVLGVANIGIYSYVNANTSYFVLISVLGMSTYAQLQGARIRDKKQELGRLFTEVFLTRVFTVFTTVCIFLVFIFLQKNYVTYYLIQLITIISGAFEFIWLFQAVEDFKIVTFRTGVIKIITIICVFLFVKEVDDLAIYFFIMAIGTLIGNISIVPLIKKYINFEKPRKGFLAIQLTNTFIFFFPTIASVLTSTVDKQMLGILYPNKIPSGYYEQAYYIENAIYMLFTALNYTMRPRMAYLFSKRNTEEINKLMNKSIDFVLFFSIPLGFGVGILSDNYIPWFLGKQYLPVSNVLYVMIFWIIFKAFSSCLLEQSIVPKGGQVLASKIIWIGTIANIILNIFFIKKYAAEGAAIASVISELLILILSLYCSRNSIDVKMTLIKFMKNLVSVLPMVLVLLFLRDKVNTSFIMTLVLTFIGAICYLVPMIITKNQVIKDIYETVVKK